MKNKLFQNLRFKRLKNFVNGFSGFRESLLGQLSVYIKQTRDELHAKTSGHEQMPKQKNMPESVNQISWVRAQEMKVRFTQYLQT